MAADSAQIVNHIACSLLAACLALPSQFALADTVAKRAAGDGAWGRTFDVLSSQLGSALRANRSSISDQLKHEFDLSDDTYRAARIYIDRYPEACLSPRKVVSRYPHYNRMALEKDLESLTTAGLVARYDENNAPHRDIEMHYATDRSREFMDMFWQLKINEARAFPLNLDDELTTVANALAQIVAAESRMDDGFLNDSIRWRLNNGYRAPDNSPPAVKVYQLMGDQIAFVNDNAHWRFDRYEHRVNKRFDLDPLAKELFAAMRDGRQYQLDRCTNQTYWRQGKAACQKAVTQLIAIDLVEKTRNGEYRQTAAGASMFREMESITTKRLYRPWLVLSQTDYSDYMKALEHIETRLQANAEQ